MKRMEYVVKSKDDGRKIKSVLRNELNMSSSLVSRVKLCEDGILLNGSRAFTNAVLQEGDILSVKIEDIEQEQQIKPVAYPLNILFEDEFLFVINKPAGMAVHPGALSEDECTVANAAAYHLGKPFVFHPANRLDRGTTGIMTIAKSAYIHELLKKELHTGHFFREYRAVAVGIPEPEKGEIDLPIGRSPDSAIKRCIDQSGDPAKTSYEVLSQKNGYSFLKLLPQTGRTHQLRVHMAAMGTPLVGDWLYGTEDREVISRPALHSFFMSLQHPVTKKQLELYAELPEDMRKLI